MPRKHATTTKKPAPSCDHGPEHDAIKLKSTGPGGLAVGVDASIKAANITRLKRSEGQVRGIVRMVEEDRYCADVIIQIAAAQESLRAVAKNLLKNHLKHCARAALKAGEAEADAMCNELMDVMGKIAR